MRKTPLVSRVEDRFHQPLEQLLRERYPRLTLQEISEELEIDISTIYYWLMKLGIHFQRVLVAYGEKVEVVKR